MRLFHVQFDCGDYYCDEMHSVGIFSTQKKADDSIPEFISRVRQELGERVGGYYARYVYKVVPRTLDEIEGYGE